MVVELSVVEGGGQVWRQQWGPARAGAGLPAGALGTRDRSVCGCEVFLFWISLRAGVRERIFQA